MTAAHHMEMHMKNDLPTAMVDIRHQAIATLSETALARQMIGHIWNGTDPSSVVRLEVEQGGNVPLRHDEEMDRSAGMNILNGQQGVIFVDFDGWLSVTDDIAKHTLCHQTIQRGLSSLTAGLGIAFHWLAQLSHGVVQLLLRILIAQLAYHCERLLVMRDSRFGVPHTRHTNCPGHSIPTIRTHEAWLPSRP